MNITDEQFSELLGVLKVIASQKYTITGAADWPILLITCGIIVALIAFMWRDLKQSMRDDRKQWQDADHDLEDRINKNLDHLWTKVRSFDDRCIFCNSREKKGS